MSSGAEYYEDNYADYERQTSARKLDFYLELVRTWVPRGSRLHELGVGLGHFLERASAEYECSGSDVNGYGVMRARSRAPRALLFEGSCEAIPAIDSPRAIVAWDVLEHLPDLEAGLATIRDRLPEGGVLIAAVPVYDGPLGWLVRRLDRDPTHVTKWGREDWRRALERQGFEIADWGGIVRRLVARRFNLHVTSPKLPLRWLGSAIWIVARKGSSEARGRSAGAD
jgi:SAM-dependent methyltransferase